MAEQSSEVRGFALYVGIDEEKAAAAGMSVAKLVAALKDLAKEIAPEAETHASVALAPTGAGGRDLDVVRRAVKDPAVAPPAPLEPKVTVDEVGGVVIDISRKRVVLNKQNAALTHMEFELLQYLVLREGKAISREELLTALRTGNEIEAPSPRVIDVHVRRLRSKLPSYEDIVRTVRGAGYRFDRHADVTVRYGAGRSPDRF